VTSDFRPEVEIRPFSACAMHPAIIIATVRSLWTWLWGRYHVPQKVLLVKHALNCSMHMIIAERVCQAFRMLMYIPTWVMQTWMKTTIIKLYLRFTKIKMLTLAFISGGRRQVARKDDQLENSTYIHKYKPLFVKK